MNIEDFFDVNNVIHLGAFKVLNETGCWPKGFIPDDIEFESCWRQIIHAKMAEKWINHAMAGNIPGIPAFDS